MMFFSLLAVVLLQMLLLQTSADVTLSINPAQIQVGLSPSLSVNCTASFTGDSSMAEIISLTVSRGNNTELASITTFFDHKVNVMSSEGITANGVINPGGHSYIHLQWDSPKDTQKGTYKCSAQGMDQFGHIVVATDVSQVTLNEVNMQDLIDRLKEMSNYTKELEEKLSLNEDLVKHLKQNISDISAVAQLAKDSLPCTFIDPPLVHEGKQYFLSKSAFTDFNESISVCNAIGGQLAEVDDLSEYHAIRNYLEPLLGPGILIVCIGGTDEGHDGTWVLPSSGENLPVEDWHYPSDASSGLDLDTDNCLCLYGAADWRMGSCYCHLYSVNDAVKYMCEL